MSGSHGHDEPLPEPTTPMWLPALGAVLFLTAAIAWTISPSTPQPAAGTGVTTTIASAAAPPPSAAAPAQAITGTRQVKIPPFRAH